MSGPSLFRQALSSTRLFVGLILLLISGVFCTITTSFFLDARAYRRGLQADGIVIGKRIVPATSDTSTSYDVTYRVRTHDGDEWEETSVIQPSAWEGLEPGGTIRVQYLAGNRNSLRVAREDPAELALGAAAATTGALALLALSMILRGGRDVWRLRRLYSNGQPTEGTVTSVHETNVSINRRIQWAIDFTFRDHHGQVQHGTSAPMPAWEAQEWVQGDKGVVRFDPARPGDCVWVGEALSPAEMKSREDSIQEPM